MALRYVGADAALNNDVVHRDYVTVVKGEDLTTEEITAAITTGLSGYALKSYADTKDALLSTQAYVDAQDNLRIKLSSKGIANGVAPLDATGKIPPGFIDGPNTQTYFRGPWSPTSYNSDINATGETTLFSCGVTDPGHPYRLAVFGEVDAHTNRDDEYPQVVVRVATEASGEVIARGRGALDAAETFTAGDTFDRANAANIEGWTVTHVAGSDADGIGIQSNEAKLLSTGDNTYSARRTDPSDAHTGTDYQRIVAVIGSDDGTNVAEPHLRLISRFSDDEESYVAYEISGNGSTRLVYSNGGAEFQIGATSTITRPTTGVNMTMVAGVPGASRTFSLYRNATLVKTVEDVGAVTAMGNTNRGWGFQLRTAAGVFFTTERPPTLNQITAGDGVSNYSPVIIIPEIGMTPRTGATTLYVRGLRSGGSSTINFSSHRPRISVMAVPA